ncbi:MAG: 4-hydroxy-3-methylbut-2-enyl diphosphate reductase [Halieaceae bacterium]|jgi:4-hydroxy-3-methylbut-2-enyl diphosphate reductase
MDIVLANPRGFCAGVDRAIDIVNRALEVFGGPVYVRHEVVHNRHVVDDLRTRGAVFVDELSEVPDDAIVIFSAHGVSRAVQDEAEGRGLQVFDATCPLVTKVHVEVAAFSAAGRECVLIGHAGHPEVEGTMGRYDTSQGGAIYLVEDEHQAAALDVRDPESLAFVTQTTLSVDDTAKVIDALRERFPEIQGPRKDDICYATQNRQDAVKSLAEEVDLVLVVGSTNSSNSNRLRELAERCGANAYLIDDASMINPEWLKTSQHVGVTAGASAPELLVQEVITTLQAHGGLSVRDLDGREENITFSLPKGLRIPTVSVE